MTRCPICERTWQGLAEAHCTVCHAHFTTVTAFDLHRVGPTDTRHCEDPATLTTAAGVPRLSGSLRATGIIWGYPSGGDGHLSRLRRHPGPGTATP
jgi:hypothetical protein